MNKQSSAISQIKYKPGDWLRDALGEYLKILSVDDNGYYTLMYVGSNVVLSDLPKEVRKNYVPSVFQVNDDVNYKNDIITIVGIGKSNIYDDYYYEVKCGGLYHCEPVKNLDAYGEFTEN